MFVRTRALSDNSNCTNTTVTSPDWTGTYGYFIKRERVEPRYLILVTTYPPTPPPPHQSSTISYQNWFHLICLYQLSVIYHIMHILLAISKTLKTDIFPNKISWGCSWLSKGWTGWIYICKYFLVFHGPPSNPGAEVCSVHLPSSMSSNVIINSLVLVHIYESHLNKLGFNFNLKAERIKWLPTLFALFWGFHFKHWVLLIYLIL